MISGNEEELFDLWKSKVGNEGLVHFRHDATLNQYEPVTESPEAKSLLTSFLPSTPAAPT